MYLCQTGWIIKRKNYSTKKTVHPQIHQVPLPVPILQFQKYVMLKWYFLFVNCMPFLTSQSRKIKFRVIERTKSRGNKTILQVVRSVIEQYQARGFKVIGHIAKNEFKCLETNIIDAIVGIVYKDEHAGSVESSIDTMKEHLICVLQNTPYKRITGFIITEWFFDVFSQYGVSNELSPCNILLRKVKIDCDIKKITPGAYHQVCMVTTNTQKFRSVVSIVLRPSRLLFHVFRYW